MTTTIQSPSMTTTGQRSVTFSLKAPQAKQVLVAGDFTDWKTSARPLKRNGRGIWSTKLSLPAGRHQYRFIVDGEWQNDPSCAECENNSFGTTNNIVDVK